MGYVYLVGEIGNDGKYKIGSTRAKKVETRLKQLQTGNPSRLYIKESFETDYPFKLEKMLHNHFKSFNLINEWFELSEEDVGRFKGICEDYHKIIGSLKDNPFYFKKENQLVAEFSLGEDCFHKYSQEELKHQIKDLTENIDKNIIMKLTHP